jgi:hypothetical protein
VKVPNVSAEVPPDVSGLAAQLDAFIETVSSQRFKNRVSERALELAEALTEAAESPASSVVRRWQLGDAVAAELEATHEAAPSLLEYAAAHPESTLDYVIATVVLGRPGGALGHEIARELQKPSGDDAPMSARMFLERYGLSLGLPLLHDGHQTTLRPQVDAFGGGPTAPVPASLAVSATIGLIDRAQTNGVTPHSTTGDPSFKYVTEGGWAMASYRNDTTATRNTWGVVRDSLDERTADLLLALLVQWAAQHDEHGWSYLSAAHLLTNYKRLQPKTKGGYTAGHRPDDVAGIATAAAQLDYIWVEVDQVEVEMTPRGRGRRRTKTQRFALEDKLFEFNKRVTQLELDGGKQPIAWRFKPGECITHFVDGPNRQMATLMRVSLEYHPLKRRWEKRLSRYFAFHPWEGSLTLGVGQLIEEVQFTAEVDRRRPGRSRRRFEDSLQRLTDDGVIGGWKPNYSDASLPPRLWADRWLASTVTLTAPALPPPPPPPPVAAARRVTDPAIVLL